MNAATNLMNAVLLALSRAGVLAFRNNVALAVVGKVEWIRGQSKTVTVHPGDAVVRVARPLHAGLCKGSGDLIGGTPVVVTPEMVGKTLLVFTSVEVKSGQGRPDENQKNFRDVVSRRGGISGVVYSEDEAVALVKRGVE